MAIDSLQTCEGCEANKFIAAAAERRLEAPRTVDYSVPQVDGGRAIYTVPRGSFLDPSPEEQIEAAGQKLSERVDMDDPLRCAEGCELLHRAADLLLHSEVRVVLSEHRSQPLSQRWGQPS